MALGANETVTGSKVGLDRSVVYAGLSVTSIQAALNAAALIGGGIVQVQRGDVNFAGQPDLIIPDGVRIRGAGPGATRFLIPPRAGYPIQSTGSQGAVVLLTANAARTDSTITVASTSGLAVGDVLLVGSNAMQSGNPAATNYKGELARVRSINSATSLTVWGQLRDDYATADSAGIRKLTLNSGVGLEDLTVVNTNPLGGTNPFTRFRFCKNVKFANVEMQGCDSTGIWLEYVLGGTIDRCLFVDFPDKLSANPPLYGYGIATYAAVEDVSVTGCAFRRLRHGFTTNGMDGSWGNARNITVSGCTSSETTAPAFDTHPGAEDIIFAGNTVSKSTHSGYSLRGPRNKVIGGSVSNSASGVWIREGAHGAVVQGVSMTNLGGSYTGTGEDGVLSTAASGYGVSIFGGVNGVTVANNHIEQILRSAVLVGSDTGTDVVCRRLRVIKNTLICVGQAGTSNHAVFFTDKVSQIHESVIEGNYSEGYAAALGGVPGSSGQLSDFIRLDRAGAVQVNGLRVLDNTVIGNAFAILGGPEAGSTNIQQLGTRDL